MNDIITGPLYHVPNCSSGPLLPNKAWWSSLPHWSRLPELTLVTFGTLNVYKSSQYTSHLNQLMFLQVQSLFSN